MGTSLPLGVQNAISGRFMPAVLCHVDGRVVKILIPVLATLSDPLTLAIDPPIPQGDECVIFAAVSP